MENYQNPSFNTAVASNFIRSVYTYMFIALAISGVVAYAIGSDADTFKSLFINDTGSVSILFWVLLFLEVVVTHHLLI